MQAAAPSFAAVPADYAGMSQTQIEFLERKRAEQGLPPLAGAGVTAPIAPTTASGMPAEYAGLSQQQIEFMERKRLETGVSPLMGIAGAAPVPAAAAPLGEPVAFIPDDPTFGR